MMSEDKKKKDEIDKNSETEQVFQKFITNDFPVGSLFNTKIIDDAIQHNLTR